MKELTLYQLADEYRQLLEIAADPEADSASFEAALNALEGDIQTKAIAVAQAARNLEAFHAQVMDAIKTMALRADRAKQGAERIRDYLKAQMEATGITKIESPYLALTIRKNPPSLKMADDAITPPTYVRHIPERFEPDKAAITKALKAGEAIDGFWLEQGTRLEIR